MVSRRIAFCMAALLSVLLAGSCGKKERDPNAACDKVRLAEYECKGDCGNALCGRWKWASTITAAGEKTPANTGRCQVLYMRHDSVWLWLVDGEQRGEGRYRTARKVAEYEEGMEIRKEPYEEILFIIQRPISNGLSQYDKGLDWDSGGFGYSYGYYDDGIWGAGGGGGSSYSVEGRSLYMGDPPGFVGGPLYTWCK